LNDGEGTRIYCTLKAEAVDRTVWGTGCGSGCGLVARQNKRWM